MARSFSMGNIELPDPDPRMTPDEVMVFYSSSYPELASGVVSTITEGVSYNFKIKDNSLS